jgi:hypothetical protein
MKVSPRLGSNAVQIVDLERPLFHPALQVAMGRKVIHALPCIFH